MGERPHDILVVKVLRIVVVTGHGMTCNCACLAT